MIYENIKSENPKVLVISYNCFSHSGSNGRTLANLFWGWDKKKIAQLYMSREIPNNDICLKYYRVTDIDVLNSMRLKKTDGEINIVNSNKKESKTENNVSEIFEKMKFSKSKIKIRYFRSILWNSGFWKSKKYYEWIKRYNPDIIFVMAGENYFVDKVAIDISKKLGIPIVVYNSENYQFKDYSRHGFFGRLFKSALIKSYNKLMLRTSYVIFLNEPLLKLFKTKYSNKSTVIYNPSMIETSKNINDIVSTISYLGRIDGRHESLIKIANTLKLIDKSLFLDLYGNITSSKIRNMIDKCESIRYHGIISYSDVIKVINNSDILVHCESFEKEEIIDKKYAFSTKIGDSLASGKCFFVYTPESNATAMYLMENNAASVVTQANQLEDNLKELISNKDLRKYYSRNALKLAETNHNIKKNTERVLDIINEVILKRDK